MSLSEEKKCANKEVVMGLVVFQCLFGFISGSELGLGSRAFLYCAILIVVGSVLNTSICIE